MRTLLTGETPVPHPDLPRSSARPPVSRHGEEPFVTVGSYRRPLTLPAALARHSAAAARVEQGELQVRFEEAVR